MYNLIMSWKKFQIILFVEQFLIKGWEVGFLILLPILKLRGEITLFEIGLLSTCLAVSQFGSSLFSGIIMKKLGNKKVVLLSIILATSSWLLLSASPNIWLMSILYLVAGASSGLFETCGVSIIAKKLGQGKRSEALGNLAVMGDLGRILFTSSTTIVVAYFGLKIFSIVNSFLGLIFLLIMFVLIKEILTNDESLTTDNNQQLNFGQYFKHKNLAQAYIVAWMDSFSSASLFIFLPLLFAGKGLPYEESGILSVMLFVGYMMGRKLLGKMADKIGTIKTLMIGETFMALIITAIVFINNFYVLLLLLLLLGMMTRGTSPVCKAFAADEVPEHLSMDNAVAIGQSGSRLSGIVSRPIFSGIAGIWGVNWVFAVSAVCAMLINVPLRIKRD